MGGRGSGYRRQVGVVLEGRGSGSQWRCAGELRGTTKGEGKGRALLRKGEVGIEPSRGHSESPEGAEASVRWRHAHTEDLLPSMPRLTCDRDV